MKPGRARTSSKAGRLLFFIPIAALAFLVVFGLLGASSTRDGTLVVEAVSSGRYAPPVPLHVSATVDGKSAGTPFNVTLPAGKYTVVYNSTRWFNTPDARPVVLAGGATGYAIGTYLPVVMSIGITQGGFNSTAVTALHSITPVVWVNLGAKAVELQIEGVGTVRIPPSLNFTHVFQSQGSFGFFLVNSSAANSNGYVKSV